MLGVIEQRSFWCPFTFTPRFTHLINLGNLAGISNIGRLLVYMYESLKYTQRISTIISSTLVKKKETFEARASSFNKS